MLTILQKDCRNQTDNRRYYYRICITKTRQGCHLFSPLSHSTSGFYFSRIFSERTDDRSHALLSLPIVNKRLPVFTIKAGFPNAQSLCGHDQWFHRLCSSNPFPKLPVQTSGQQWLPQCHHPFRSIGPVNR